MSNPSISENLYIKQVNQNEYGVFTNQQIARNTIVETCIWIPVTQRMQILITKNSETSLLSKLFENPDGINKEREILSKIADMELDKRLEAGLINPDQVKAIINEVAGPAKLLHIHSHAILLGYGSIYRKSQFPNIAWDYNAESKLYRFYTVEDIRPNQELTYFTK